MSPSHNPYSPTSEWFPQQPTPNPPKTAVIRGKYKGELGYILQVELKDKQIVHWIVDHNMFSKASVNSEVEYR